MEGRSRVLLKKAQGSGFQGWIHTIFGTRLTVKTYDASVFRPDQEPGCAGTLKTHCEAAGFVFNMASMVTSSLFWGLQGELQHRCYNTGRPASWSFSALQFSRTLPSTVVSRSFLVLLLPSRNIRRKLRRG